MIDAISKLVESGAISEDTQKAIQEAWDSKIKENKEVVGAELREEFAKKFDLSANTIKENLYRKEKLLLVYISIISWHGPPRYKITGFLSSIYIHYDN